MMEQIIQKRYATKSSVIDTIEPGLPDDLFISCIGYEERTLGILNKLNHSYRAKSALILQNEELYNLNRLLTSQMKLMKFQKKVSFFENTKRNSFP